MVIRFLVLVSLFVTPPCFAAEGETWVEVNDTAYGAKPDDRGPIGGGEGYALSITKGDHTVKDTAPTLRAQGSRFTTTPSARPRPPW